MKLESTCSEEYSLEPGLTTAYIIDGMALLQALNEANFNLFDDLGKQVMRSIQKLFQNNLNIRVITVCLSRRSYWILGELLTSE